MIGATPEATAEIWRFVLDIDWYATLEASLLPLDHPLFLLLATPRRMKFRVGDSLWVRLVDVGAALSAARTRATAASSSRFATPCARGTRAAGSSRAAGVAHGGRCGARARRRRARAPPISAPCRSRAAGRPAGRGARRRRDRAGGCPLRLAAAALVPRDLLSYLAGVGRVLRLVAAGACALALAAPAAAHTDGGEGPLAPVARERHRSRAATATTAPSGIPASTSARSARSTSPPLRRASSRRPATSRTTRATARSSSSTSATASRRCTPISPGSTVHQGDRLLTGQKLGNAGCTGYCTGTHLHFELRERGEAFDPAPLLPRIIPEL